MIEVAAGVLSDARGRVLLLQRKPGTHLAGAWEFPGGKLEPGEHIEQALRRELYEELGIEAHAFAPVISIPWRYPEKFVRMHVLRVTDWGGEPRPREGHPLRWAGIDDIDVDAMPAADRPVVGALRLPALYAISPPDFVESISPLAWLKSILRDPCAPLVQLRLPMASRCGLRELLDQVLADDPAARTRLLVNACIDLARELGIGVHLRAGQLRELRQRPLPPTQWVGASCHDASELELAAGIGADFAVLAPVLATPSHLQASSIGWSRFAELTFDARLPVYALGGVGRHDLPRARAAGAQGVAGIRAFAR
ncbi:MAG: Nudix family hydrolase [Rhodanobacteraceae bacterium]